MKGINLRRIMSCWIVCVTVVFSILYAQQSTPATPSNVVSVFESLRVVGGIVGMGFGILGVIFGITGAVAYWQIGKQTNQNKALNDTVGIYENKIVALESKVKDLEKSNTGLVARIEEKDKALTDLQKRTDLTKVLEMLTTFTTSYETRNIEGMKIFTEAMKMQREDFSKEFSKVITKFAGIEACINSVCEKLGVSQQERNGHLGKLSREQS